MGQGYQQGTVTLAKVFAEQGHWEKAVEIYRDVLRQDPDRPDVAHALAEAEAALRAAGSTSAQALAPLFQEWIDLLLTFDRLHKLRRFNARMERVQALVPRASRAPAARPFPPEKKPL